MSFREVIKVLVKTLLVSPMNDLLLGIIGTMLMFMFVIGEAGGNPIALPILMFRAIKSWIFGTPMDWSPIEL
jgi:hypothetical protein